MQFIIIAKDGNDAEAMSRRLAAREDHIAYGAEAAKRGEQIIAAALLDENEDMRGSLLIVDFENIEALHKWLDDEAYIKGNVWQDVDIIQCKIAPTFDHLVKKSHN